MRRLALALVLLSLAGCGSETPPPGPGSEAEAKWAAAALNLLAGLDDALPRIQNAGVGRSTLEDESLLYEALLGYTYVDSCSELLGQLGEPSARQRKAHERLDDACRHLGHASEEFTRAVRTERVSVLAGAAREALATVPLLREARAELGSG